MQNRKTPKKQEQQPAAAVTEEVKAEQPSNSKKSRSRTPAGKAENRQPVHAPPTTTTASNKKSRPTKDKIIESEASPMPTSRTKKA
jgi:hypothetical protein